MVGVVMERKSDLLINSWRVLVLGLWSTRFSLVVVWRGFASGFERKTTSSDGLGRFDIL